MKKLLVLGIFLGVIGVFALNAHALTYTITSYPGRPAWAGGAFLINWSMPTYCLEYNEYMSFNVPYYGTINDYAIQGGVTGTVKGGGPPSSPGQDYLDYWSEWLVANYLSHSLTSPENMKNFQEAIWYIEGEKPSLVVDPLGTDYYALVFAVKPTTDYAWIRVLNLYEYDSSGNIKDKQSLIITPEPTTLLLLGAGLLGLGFMVRRKIKS